METKPEDNWSCGGWANQERGQLEAGAKLSFRERLLWLQGADRFVAALEAKRPWIDKDGVPHLPKQF